MLIVIEGLDGAGKRTLTQGLQAALEALDDPEVLSRHREAPTKRDVVAAAERVKTDAAKSGFGVPAARRPPPAACLNPLPPKP